MLRSISEPPQRYVFLLLLLIWFLNSMLLFLTSLVFSQSQTSEVPGDVLGGQRGGGSGEVGLCALRDFLYSFVVLKSA
jgi:hypothetical protein